MKQKPIVTPIVQSTTFLFPDTASLIDYQKGKKRGYIYTRYSNPTIEAVERDIASLEGSGESLLFSSGMAAISSVCMTFLKAGDEIASSFPVYGGTAKLFDSLFVKFGIKTKYFPAGRVERLEKIISPKTKIIYMETPTNPNLLLIDLPFAAKIARKNKIISVVDSTFATPVNQKPIGFGIDYVIHSVTKFMAGHSDIMGGVVSGPIKGMNLIYETRKLLGGCMDPHQAFLLDRGLRTLEVRMERHNSNAARIAGFLASSDKVKKVIYPGLETHPQYELAVSQMAGFGGMVSFDIGSKKKAAKFVDSLRVVKNAVSLGGVESLVSIPIWTSHYGLKKKDLDRSGITPGLIRLSAGLEDPELLVGDIKAALKKAVRS